MAKKGKKKGKGQIKKKKKKKERTHFHHLGQLHRLLRRVLQVFNREDFQARVIDLKKDELIKLRKKKDWIGNQA
jgi:hypothetical protein